MKATAEKHIQEMELERKVELISKELAQQQAQKQKAFWESVEKTQKQFLAQLTLKRKSPPSKKEEEEILKLKSRIEELMEEKKELEANAKSEVEQLAAAKKALEANAKVEVEKLAAANKTLEAEATKKKMEDLQKTLDNVTASLTDARNEAAKIKQKAKLKCQRVLSSAIAEQNNKHKADLGSAVQAGKMQVENDFLKAQLADYQKQLADKPCSNTFAYPAPYPGPSFFGSFGSSAPQPQLQPMQQQIHQQPMHQAQMHQPQMHLHQQPMHKPMHQQIHQQPMRQQEMHQQQM